MLEEIKKRYDLMSKGQKRIADYISDNYEQAAFMTAARLGEAAKVSESTVVRFAVMMGYAGYTEFQEEMAGRIREKLVSPKKTLTNHYRENKNDLLRGVLVADAQNIVDTIHLVDSGAFERAVDIIESARKVYIVGIRTCAPLASYLAYYLNMIREDVISVTSPNITELYEQLYWMNSEDALLGISFPRYSLRTLKAMEFGNERNARLITISDSEYSPMNMYSSCNLWAKTDMVTVADSLVAPMSIINALTVALFMRNEEKVTKNLKDMEKVWNDFQIYETDDMTKIGE